VFELIAYKIFRINTFFWAYGADVRTRIRTEKMGKINCCTYCPSIEKACICKEHKGNINYNTIYRYATKCFSMGDMVHYTPGSDNSVFYWPIDIDIERGKKYQPVYPTGDINKSLVIVHAANHREFKGTNFLIKAVNELIEDGFLIDLRLIEKMPNIEALENYRLADIVFDQCVIGFHGYFALEGMALGKPVMSFIRNPNEDLLMPNQCPIINISIETIKVEIARLYHNRSSLVEIGKRGRKYIENFYTLEAVSGRMALAFHNLRV
jgi:glycosyltransferase involved in cell wall biosynthesis